MSVSRALVLSGGGGRGAYQAGVWAWLQEQGWKPDLVSGSSVGAINGAAVASGVSAEQLKDLWCSIDSAQVFRRWPTRLPSADFSPRSSTSPRYERAKRSSS